MSNVLLAIFGTGILVIAFAGFSVYQLEKTAAQAGNPGRTQSPQSEPGDDDQH